LQEKREAKKLGSHRFVTYTTIGDRCTVEYLRLFFCSQPGLEILRRVSPGSAGRNRTLNIAQFAYQEIPLPRLEEQLRIVARVEELVGKIEEARSLRQQTLEETEALFAAESTKLLDKIFINGTLSDVLHDKPRNGWSARCDNLQTGIPVLSLGAVTGFSYNETEFKRTSEVVSQDAHYWLKPGALLITRSNSPELVGHAAIYNGSPSPCIYPDLMMRLDVNESKADKQFVHHWLACAPIRNYIKSHAKGTSPSMKKISQGVVMNIPFPTELSLPEQHRIVAYLDNLKQK
jgi:type I restriction enzyme S subunit